MKKEIKEDKMSKEARDNLVGFFSLLLKIDKRLNPQNYKSGIKNSSKSPQK
jgi:hypothetical protein